MGLFRLILAIVFPPFAVIDKGCGSFLLVTILSLLGWIPGVLAALVIVSSDNSKGKTRKDKNQEWNEWVERNSKKTQAFADKYLSGKKK